MSDPEREQREEQDPDAMLGEFLANQPAQEDPDEVEREPEGEQHEPDQEPLSEDDYEVTETDQENGEPDLEGLGERSRKRVLESREEVKAAREELERTQKELENAKSWEKFAVELASPRGQAWLRSAEGRNWQMQTYGTVYTDQEDASRERGEPDREPEQRQQQPQFDPQQMHRMMQFELDMRDTLAGLEKDYGSVFDKRKDGDAVKAFLMRNPNLNGEQALFALYPDRIKEMQAHREREEHADATTSPGRRSPKRKPSGPKSKMDRLLEAAEKGDHRAGDAALGAYFLKQFDG